MSTPAAQAYAQAQQTAHTQLGLRTLDGETCDRCGHAAYVRTESHYSTLHLTWCAHHYTEVEQHFSAATHEITDERPHLHWAVKAQAGQD